MHIKILTPEKLLYDGALDLVQVPGKSGSFAVLKNHAPIISTLEKGRVRVKHGGEEQVFDIPGGVIQVKNNEIIILTQMSE
ncbi:MAG: ATP synthase F1 subunit epsilon [Salinivirgaceae bacterium]|jgi:F-type H+-transporting ATPase subunit epsilon|nr:ATP synthase F1 subunit epsilon [Salinivirgaceae bacterium]